MTGESLPLIQTKLFRPPILAGIIPRPRLVERLNARWQDRPLTLISAPAGYGKSVLASMWLQECDCRSAWVSLDETDNDLATFTAYLLAAVRQALPDLQLQSAALLELPALPPVSILVRYLLNDLHASSSPFILVLDDIHIIHDQAIFELLNELLRHPPPAMHLVLVGRHDPPITIASLRAYRHINEIRGIDLRFTVSETAELLEETLHRSIAPEVAADWAEKTGGWATALHLAALSLQYRRSAAGSEAPILANSNYLQEYLLAEVLARVSPEKQTWLLRTSVLDRFCAPLCEAVCQEEGESLTGKAFVSWLQASNLFLIPLDDQVGWFQFHHLFQESLQALLRRQVSDGEIAGMHERASAWCSENGSIEYGIRYALAAEDIRGAVALLAQQRHQLMDAERWHQLGRLHRLFPVDVVDNDPVLAITKAHLPEGYGLELARLLPRVRQMVADLPVDSPVARETKGELAYFEGLWGTLTGPAALAIKRADDMLALLPEKAQWLRSAAIGLKNIGLQMSGNYEQGISFANETLDDPNWSTNSRARMLNAQTYASFMEGDLERVQRSVAQYLKIATKNQLKLTMGEGHYLSGISHYIRNETDLAERLLSVFLEERMLLDPLLVANGVCALTRTYRAQGQPEKARKAFELVFSHIAELGNAFSLEILRAFQVDLALDEGELAEARRLSQSVVFEMDHPVWYQYVHQLMPIRLWLAEGDAGSLRKAAAALEELDQQLLTINRRTHRVDVLALQALVHDAQGNRQEALEKLHAALHLAQPGGFIRNFVDLGPSLARLLAWLQAQGDTELDTYISQILAAFPIEERSTTSPDLENPLTKRELQTLRLLATDLTPQEIAVELTISVNTTRTHIRNIYRKLDVQSRYTAVVTARQLNLI